MTVSSDEQRVDLSLIYRNGALGWLKGNGRNLPELQLGRTASKRGLGFMLTRGKRRAIITRFVLDREQLKLLRTYLDVQLRRVRRDIGPRQPRRHT